MGFFDKLKQFGNVAKNTPSAENKNCFTPNNNVAPAQSAKRGYVSANKIELNNDTIEKLKHRYIAFDVETTGFSAYTDRIIEVGAIIFENEVPIREFETLVNPKMKIPYSASAVNHITDDMVANAPTENVVCSELINFLGDALDGKTIICAHNAKFDIDFLSQALIRLGYDAKITYIDTLQLSRSLVHGLDSYRQPAVASHFEIPNEHAHRAASDAKVCGTILSKLLDLKRQELYELHQREVARNALKEEYRNKRNSITITPVHSRVPLNEILNLNDWDKGYTMGSPFWETGETLRKSGDIQLAIELFDKARYNGYCAPALYNSYAIAYRQLKDYENEIAILDEAVKRFDNCESFEDRRYKAICLLIKQNEKLAQEQEKLKQKQEKQNKAASPKQSAPRKSQGRAVLQLSDDMTLIKKFDTIAETSQETGVNPKSIRDAAKGIQKHAGGFVWKYAEENPEFPLICQNTLKILTTIDGFNSGLLEYTFTNEVHQLTYDNKFRICISTYKPEKYTIWRISPCKLIIVNNLDALKQHISNIISEK